MVDSHLYGGKKISESVAARYDSEALKLSANAFDFDGGTRSWRLNRDRLVTYKRRRHSKVAADQSVSQPGEKICQFLDRDHALKDCLQNALEFNPKCTSHNRTLQNGPENGATGNLGMASGASVRESKYFTLTELCKMTFSDVIVSEKFAKLCSLFLENFQGLNDEKIFNLNNISARMKEGVYESSPLLFQSDIQEILIKFEKIGTDITSLARGLSDKAISSFREQMSNSAHNFSNTDKSEFIARQSDIDYESDQTAAHDLDEAHICQQCTNKAVGRNSLVCDSCEGMYHISCIKPALKEIPNTWYCSVCTAKGTESSHDDCTACERLNETESLSGQSALASSNKSEATKGSKQSAKCKTCRTEVRNEDHRICGHSLCSHKFYHTKCLTSKQLISYGPFWHCPSCLCGSCFLDRDDYEIVRCDGCDHAYHTYCMQLPRRSTRPEGKWFCQTCDNGIQPVQRARRLHENISRKRGLDGRIKSEMNLQRTGDETSVP